MLPRGFIPAVEALKHRVPEGTSAELSDVAARAFERLVDVMEERVFEKHAGNVLKAATALREEICGSVTQKLQHSGDGAPFNVIVQTYKREEARGLPDEKPAASHSDD